MCAKFRTLPSCPRWSVRINRWITLTPPSFHDGDGCCNPEMFPHDRNSALIFYRDFYFPDPEGVKRKPSSAGRSLSRSDLLPSVEQHGKAVPRQGDDSVLHRDITRDGVHPHQLESGGGDFSPQQLPVALGQ